MTRRQRSRAALDADATRALAWVAELLSPALVGPGTLIGDLYAAVYECPGRSGRAAAERLYRRLPPTPRVPLRPALRRALQEDGDPVALYRAALIELVRPDGIEEQRWPLRELPHRLAYQLLEISDPGRRRHLVAAKAGAALDADTLPDETEDPAARLDEDEAVELLYRALDQAPLPPAERKVVQLAAAGFSRTQMATLCHVTPATISNRLARARRTLRASLPR
ncbi:MAG TPA: sigma factor-like helix-turn-helix DNA-binding protein [Gemmatimonadales bacterium]